MPTIEIVVSPQGESQVQTKGFSGEACRTASRFLEHALGRSSHDQLTSEFHQVSISKQAAEFEST